MSVAIRPARVDDVPAILAIYNEAVANTTASWDHDPVTLKRRLERFEASRANGWAITVADEDGRVLGYGSWGPFRSQTGFAQTMEHSVYVDAAARGRGVGRLLVQAIIETARAAGVHALVGCLDATNDVSLRLHESLGFVEVGRLPQVGAKFGRWLDLAFLELLLDDAAAPGDGAQEPGR